MLLLNVMIMQAAIVAPAPRSECWFEKSQILSLDYDAFDQNMLGGWRKLAARGCKAEAADLIGDWREAHQIENRGRRSILFWHQGQLLAEIGRTEAAIKLFEQSRKTPEEDVGMGWNPYVHGTIAFLRGDRRKLQDARKRLADLPMPAGMSFNGPDGKLMAIKWPLNLSVLDGFLQCWGKPYVEAYSCAAPMRRVEVK